jgi:hypothetical protein
VDAFDVLWVDVLVEDVAPADAVRLDVFRLVDARLDVVLLVADPVPVGPVDPPASDRPDRVASDPDEDEPGGLPEYFVRVRFLAVPEPPVPGPYSGPSRSASASVPSAAPGSPASSPAVAWLWPGRLIVGRPSRCWET